MKILKGILSLTILTLALSACSSDDSSPTDPNNGSNNKTPVRTSIEGLADCNVQNVDQGVVCGKAVAADGVTPLAGAEIKILTPVSNQLLGAITTTGVADSGRCLADALGDFACLVPQQQMGSQQFIIEFAGFAQKSFVAMVMAGQVTNTGAQIMVGDTSANWLVVPGYFDGVQVLLAQLKGCTLNSLSGGVFNPITDFPADARSSADCIEKGLLVLDDDEANMASPYYVTTFLASTALNDYDALFINCDADLGLAIGVNSALQQFSGAGKHIYFSDLSSFWLETVFPGRIAFLGNDTITGTISGSVTYPGLAGVVGNNIDLVFDLDIWSAIGTVDTSVTTYIEGDITTLSSVYTGVHPITVGWRPNLTSGCVFYTSYHIEGASNGAPQELAIKYLVQNINQVCT